MDFQFVLGYNSSLVNLLVFPFRHIICPFNSLFLLEAEDSCLLRLGYFLLYFLILTSDQDATVLTPTSSCPQRHEPHFTLQLPQILLTTFAFNIFGD